MDLLQLKGVSKRFGTRTVLDNVSFTVAEGEILGIVGMNGSGKTTLLKLLVGYYQPNKGTIAYRGHALENRKKEMLREIGFTAQESSFYPKLTVEENILYFGSLYGLHEKQLAEHAERMLAFLDLMQQRHQLSEQLSGGMQRRLEMACSLVHDPKVLILDETTEDLDPLLRRDILGLIKKVNDLGTTVILTSHLLGDVEALCDRIVVLHQGKVLRVGNVEQLRKLYHGKEEIHVQTASGVYDTLVHDLQLLEFYVDKHTLVIYTNDADTMTRNLLAVLENEGDRLLSLDVRKPSLQDVFEELTNTRWL